MKKQLPLVALVASLAILTSCEKNIPLNFVESTGQTRLDTMYWVAGYLQAEAYVSTLEYNGEEKIDLSISHLLSEEEIYRQYLTNPNLFVYYEVLNDSRQHDDYASPEVQFEIMAVIPAE